MSQPQSTIFNGPSEESNIKIAQQDATVRQIKCFSRIILYRTKSI